MDTIFTVQNVDLERLSPAEAVELFRELLWAESVKVGSAASLIDVPSAINVADGGIDAEVRDAPSTTGSGIINQGLTRYQIKTGNFSLDDSGIRDILFKPSTTELKPRVKGCLDRRGTLIIVLFGWDNPDRTDDQGIAHKFRAKLSAIQATYATARIEIWRQNNLRSYLSQFPSLALKANHRASLRFQTHQSWSREAEMSRLFKGGQAQQDMISGIQTQLRKNTEAVHLRIWGEPGIGKSRLVLEATGPDDLRPLVIHCDSASKFRDSDLMNEILREDNHFSAILVVDECDPEARSYIWNKLKNCGPRIKLVTIHNEYDQTSGSIAYFDTPPLDKEHIGQIIQDYGIPKDQTDRWVELCSGSPRVAHVIGWNLKTNQDDLLKSPDTVNVWERYVVGENDPNGSDVRQRKVVLRHLALFKRFGYGHPVIREAQEIERKVNATDPSITWGRFQEIIQDLRERKILQGEHTLYITPKALHIKLWTEWWETYGPGFDFGAFLEGLSPNLVEWFHEMFKYAQGSKAAADIVKELLGKSGPFKDES